MPTRSNVSRHQVRGLAETHANNLDPDRWDLDTDDPHGATIKEIASQHADMCVSREIIPARMQGDYRSMFLQSLARRFR
jgi:hypothetical protein